MIKEVKSFGDARVLILETILAVRDGNLGASQAMAIAANMQTLNHNIQCEINSVKLQLACEKAGHGFGKVMAMGTKLIGENRDDVTK